MAQNIKLTTLVDVDLQQGKVDSSKLQKQLPKLLQQAVANLPGAKAVISPEIKVNPKLNVKDMTKQLNDLLTDTRFNGLTGTKGFQDMEKAAIKYSRALEHIDNIQNQFKNSRGLEKFFQQWQAGAVSLSSAPEKMQKQVLDLRNHWQEIGKTWNQVQREFSKINDAVHTPMQLKELRSLQNSIKYRQDKITGLDSKATAIVAGAGAAKDLGAITNKRDKYVKEVAQLKANLQEFKAPGKRQLGALADPAVAKLTNSINSFVAGIDKRIAEERKAAERDVKAIKKTSDARSSEQAKAAYRKDIVQSFADSDLRKLTTSQARVLKKALEDQQSTLRSNAEKTGDTGFHTTPAYLASLKRSEDLKEANEYKKQRAAAFAENQVRDKAAAKKAAAETQKTTDARAKAQQEMSHGKGVVASLSRIPYSDLTSSDAGRLKRSLAAQADTLLRQGRKAGDTTVSESAPYKAITRDIDRLEAERLNRLFDEKRRLQNATRAAQIAAQAAAQASARPARIATRSPGQQADRDFEAAQIRRGRLFSLGERDPNLTPRQAYAQSRARELQGVADTAPADRQARRAYLTARIEATEGRQTSAARTSGVNSAEYQRATEATRRLADAHRDLAHAGRATHGPLESVGRLLTQFARYGIGYAALYKLTQGLQEMGKAVVDLEDNLKGIQAITGTTDTAMLTLGATVKQVASTTGFGLNEISDAVKIIAQAGVDLKDIPKTVQAVANLATAAGTSLATAADVITTAREVWESADAVTISDRVAQASNISKLAVEDLKTVFNVGATFFKAGNLSLDQALGTIATLRNAGVKASTIGTGTGQLLTELQAPDKNLATFLSEQYEKKGEKVSADEAAKRFEGYKLSKDPLVSALAELKRIGADSVGSLSRLQRSVDKRAFNVLKPLLDDANDLQGQTARLSFAPTAREASQVALDSLKKATANLVDSMETLSVTLGKAITPALADLVRSTTRLVHWIDHVVDEAQKSDTGVNYKFSLAAAAAGGTLGLRSGGGLLSRAFKGAAGAVAGGAGTLGADVYAKNQLEQSESSAIDTVENVATAGALTVGAIAIFKKAWASLSAKFTTQAGTSVATAGTGLAARALQSITGLFPAIGAALQARLGASVLAGALAAPIAGMVGSILAAVSTLLLGKEIYDAITHTDVQADAARHDDQDFRSRADRHAKESAASTSKRQDYTPYLPPEDGQSLSQNTLYGAYQLSKDELDQLRAKVGVAIGAVLTEDRNYQVLELVEKIRRYGSEKGPERERLSAELTQQLGGTQKASEDLLQEALILSGSVQGSIEAQRNALADQYDRLLAADKPEAGSLQEAQLKVLDELARSDAGFRKLLVERVGSEETVQRAMAGYTEGLANANAAVESTTEEMIRQLREWVEALSKIDPANVVQVDKYRSQIIQKYRAALDKIGVQFLDQMDQILAQGAASTGNYVIEKQLIKGKDGNTIVRNARVPEQTPETKAQQRAFNDFKRDYSIKAQTRDSSSFKKLEGALGQFEAVLKSKPQLGKTESDLAQKAAAARDEIKALHTESEQVREQFEKAADPQALAAAQQRQTALANRGNEAVKRKQLTRDPDGNFTFGSDVERVNAIIGLDEISKNKGRFESTGSKTPKAPVIPEFVGSAEYDANEERIRQAERRKEDLRKTDLKALTGRDDPANPLVIAKQAALANLREEASFISAQPYPEAKHTKDRLLKDNTRKQEDMRAEFDKEIDKLSFDLGSKIARNAVKVLDEQLQDAKDNRDKFSQAGQTREVSTVNKQIEDILVKRVAAEQELLKYTEDSTDRAAEQLDLNRRIVRQRADLLGLEAQIKSAQENAARLESLPIAQTGKSSQDAYQQGQRQVTGQAPAISDQARKLAGLVLAHSNNVAVFSKAVADREEKLKTTPAGPERDKLSTELITAKDAVREFSKSLGIAEQELADLSPTLLNEMKKLSAGSIGAKLQDLPGSLKNLHTNIEDRVVTAVDGVSSLMAESAQSVVSDLLGIGEAASESSAALSALRDAQIQLNDVVLGSLDVAEQISSIRANETDPMRQEYLINRALDAQAEAENLARQQVAQAQDQYESAQYRESTLGKAATLGADLFGGIAQDVVKGGILKSLGGLFGTVDGSSRDTALWVRMADATGLGGLAGSGSGKDGKGLLGGIGDWWGNLFGDKPETNTVNLPASGTTPYDQVLPKTEDFLSQTSDNLDDTFAGADKVFDSTFGEGGSVGKLFDGFISGMKGIFSGGGIGGAIGGTVGSLVSGIGSAAGAIGNAFSSSGAGAGSSAGAVGGIISGLASIYGTVSNYLEAEDRKPVDIVQRATGGMVSGPGTATSDSIPAALSNGEYVINAKAVRRIGKDTLDAWNFNLSHPARFAAGGMVNSMRSAVSSRQAAAAQPSEAPAAPPPAPQSIRVVMVDDQRRVGDYISSAAGERTLIDFVRRNSLSLRQVLQG
jgi:TP901 family phage tail tape measure protein